MAVDRHKRYVRTEIDADTFDALAELAKREHSTIAREARLAILDRLILKGGDVSPGQSVKAA